MMDNRRTFLSRALTMGLIYGVGTRLVRAQGGPGYYLSPAQLVDRYGPVVEIPQSQSDWFEKLKRPDVAAGHPHAPNDVMATAVSCCSAGDAYPIEIIKNATPPHGGTAENGIALVTDTSKRQLMVGQRNENGSIYRSTKFRQELKTINPAFAAPEVDPFAFKFSSDRVTREVDGNPTDTAWVFFRVTYVNADFVYCVVPLPPSA